ncbi:PREDICTED: uncharacterized protein LOC109479935 isoform X2 [Branchiostoma belcheri]|uniref:Uncharacterized protein LOC109479935 isoform X2 n=1 Tax=Branchiostoma belcheri TaxID=7741 RepID=A0A6P4ZU00_BRABE|nr:PREDICTED: uncharacterized protein LOC109479935 isoform X2 [Branchiostoma belcheri]
MDQQSVPEFSQALEDVLQKTRKGLQQMSSPAGDLCLGSRLQVHYESLKSNSDVDSCSSNRVLDFAVSNSRYQLEIELLRQQLSRSEKVNQNSQEENTRLRQQLSNSQQGHNARVERKIRELQDEVSEGRRNLQKGEKERQDLREALQLSESKVKQQQKLVEDYTAAAEMAQQDLQHLTERVRELDMLLRSFYPLLPSTEMVETFLHDIPVLKDYCLLVSHLEKCSSCLQVVPLFWHVKTCDKVCCEKCKMLVNLYIGHVAHCQETTCKVPYCMHFKTRSQQLNLSTQDLATNQQFHKEVLSCLQRVIPQATESDGILLHQPGEHDPYHRRQMTPALQTLLRLFSSHVKPVQELMVWCFKHHKEWSSLSHEKNCPVCHIFQPILRRCGTCHVDMCETCVIACCACAKYTLQCRNDSCTFPFWNTPFKTSVCHRDTTYPSRVKLTMFREVVRQICYALLTSNSH